MNDFERRNRPLFPMSIVIELTELTARQIRYYEENDLINPARTKGGHRIFSFADIDSLLEIKSLLEKGINLAGVKELFIRRDIEQNNSNYIRNKKTEVSYSDLRKKLKNQLALQKPGQTNSLIQGDVSRFFH